MGTKRRIGEEAFCVNSRGEIRRTAVQTVRHDGEYGLLYASGSRHFFDIEEALDATEATLRELLRSEDITKKEEIAFAERLEKLRAPETRAAILSQELSVGPKLHGVIPEQPLGAVDFPSEYLEPGMDVFGIVTPSTHNTMSPAWRPHPYFILAARIRSVSFLPIRGDGLQYRLDGTWYSIAPDRIFAIEEDARAGMVAVFEQETGGTILPERIRVLPAGEEMGRLKAVADTVRSLSAAETEDGIAE